MNITHIILLLRAQTSFGEEEGRGLVVLEGAVVLMDTRNTYMGRLHKSPRVYPHTHKSEGTNKTNSSTYRVYGVSCRHRFGYPHTVYA